MISNLLIGSLMVRYVMYFGPIIIISITRCCMQLTKDNKVFLMSLVFVINLYEFIMLQYSSAPTVEI